MARPTKQTVKYFPHDTDASKGRTLTILEHKFGNDGYTFWFKLLELLGRSRAHYYIYMDADDLEFLSAETKQKDTETTLAILTTLATRGAIDKELYEHKIIWCQNFVNGIADAYARCKDSFPSKPDWRVIVGISGVSADINPEKPDNNPHTIVKETKLKETITTESLSSLIAIWEREKFGEMTPLIESELQAALKEFGAEKIAKALQIAVRAGKRNWSYVAGILTNWRSGRGKGETNPDKYIKQKYGAIVCRTKEDLERVRKARDE